MELTWKDGLTTVGATMVAFVSYAAIKAFDWPLLTNYRIGALVLGVVGIAMCTLSSANPVQKSAWGTVGTVLGIIAGILVLATLLFGTKLLFLATAGSILVLWLLTTLHHIVGSG